MPCLFALLLSAAARVAVADVPVDPTRPLLVSAQVATATGAVPDRPTLASVLIGPERRVAVIDGRRMSEGEEREGIKVWRIRPDGVEVSIGGAPRMLLALPGSGMHKTPTHRESP